MSCRCLLILHFVCVCVVTSCKLHYQEPSSRKQESFFHINNQYYPPCVSIELVVIILCYNQRNLGTECTEFTDLTKQMHGYRHYFLSPFSFLFFYYILSTYKFVPGYRSERGESKFILENIFFTLVFNLTFLL